jgi:hypothetical protein
LAVRASDQSASTVPHITIRVPQRTGGLHLALCAHAGMDSRASGDPARRADSRPGISSAGRIIDQWGAKR